MPDPLPGILSLALPVTMIAEVPRVALFDITKWTHEGREGNTLALEGGDLVLEYRGVIFMLRAEDVRAKLLELLDAAGAAGRALDAAAGGRRTMSAHLDPGPEAPAPELAGAALAAYVREGRLARARAFFRQATLDDLLPVLELLEEIHCEEWPPGGRAGRVLAKLDSADRIDLAYGALTGAIGAMTIDVDGGARPNGPAEQAVDNLRQALDPANWPLGTDSMRTEDILERLIRAHQYASEFYAAHAEQLLALKLAAEGYFGGDFGAAAPADAAPEEDVIHG